MRNYEDKRLGDVVSLSTHLYRLEVQLAEAEPRQSARAASRGKRSSAKRLTGVGATLTLPSREGFSSSSPAASSTPTRPPQRVGLRHVCRESGPGLDCHFSPGRGAISPAAQPSVLLTSLSVVLSKCLWVRGEGQSIQLANTLYVTESGLLTISNATLLLSETSTAHESWMCGED